MLNILQTNMILIASISWIFLTPKDVVTSMSKRWRTPFSSKSVNGPKYC